jgi:ribosome-associated protein
VTQPNVTKPKDIDLARQFAIEAARLAANTRCSEVVVLDVSAISPVTDFLLLATGTSARQMQSVCQEIEEVGQPLGFKALNQSGLEGESWMVQDFFQVVVHLFGHEARAYYDLDGLWGDAKKVEWKQG